MERIVSDAWAFLAEPNTIIVFLIAIAWMASAIVLRIKGRALESWILVGGVVFFTVMSLVSFLAFLIMSYGAPMRPGAAKGIESFANLLFHWAAAVFFALTLAVILLSSISVFHWLKVRGNTA